VGLACFGQLPRCLIDPARSGKLGKLASSIGVGHVSGTKLAVWSPSVSGKTLQNDWRLVVYTHKMNKGGIFLSASLAVGVIIGLAGCGIFPFPPTPTPPTPTPPGPTPPTPPAPPVFNNTTDRTNDSANYIGSATCKACHTEVTPDIVDQHILSGRSYKLNRIQGAPPVYPAEATRAGVPNPPDGKSWFDVSWVIGGYIRKGRFINLDGFTMTDGVDGVNTQWNLSFPANGTQPGWTSYHGSQVDPKEYGFSCFVCHTTGPQSLEDNGGLHQDNKTGHTGTWAEAGIQCEACHGPGSKHLPNPAARNIFVDINGERCKECHDRPFNNGGSVIQASGGYIRHHEQYAELMASGAHANFSCLNCHNPHAGPNYDRANALVKECTDCHVDKTLKFHTGKVYVRGDYTEALSCRSCHMPFATKSATAAVVGDSAGRVGDMKTHIFRINTAAVDYNTMFTVDGGEVAKDASGRAAVTLDYICLRCHNTEGGFPFLLTLNSASAIASGYHD